VLNAAASNIDGFLWRVTCVSSFSRIGLYGTNRAYLHFEEPKLKEVFLYKTNKILTGKQCA
jgi:hypothetical protein